MARARMPPRPPMTAADAEGYVALVTVATFTEVYLAQLARLRLEAEGIEAHLSDEHLASMMHPASDGGVKVRVRAGDVEVALAALRADHAAAVDALADEARADEPDAPAVCARCGSASVAPGAVGRRGLFARLFGARWRCLTCGRTWR